MALVHLVSPLAAFGPWDYRNPDHPGIGGSETMHCEMAWRLAARGHEVHSYAPLREDTAACHRGVWWHSLEETPAIDRGLIILIRGMNFVEQFPPRPGRVVWTVHQDIDWPPEWPETWLPYVQRVIGLCRPHVNYLKARHLAFADKVCQSRNGLRGDLVDVVLAESPRVRNPKRILFASSPDRGLYALLHAFKLIRFHHPDAELWVAYGFDNIDQLRSTARLRWERVRLDRGLQQPGVTVVGRLGQPELYRRWTECGLMMAPTSFHETGFIALMEAQALGAIPIVNPVWAAGENQVAGIGIPGDPDTDALSVTRFAMAAVFLMDHPEVQDEARPAMMAEARKRFDWEGVVDQYETWMQEDGIST